jgi:hypothetical protein
VHLRHRFNVQRDRRCGNIVDRPAQNKEWRRTYRERVKVNAKTRLQLLPKTHPLPVICCNLSFWLDSEMVHRLTHDSVARLSSFVLLGSACKRGPQLRVQAIQELYPPQTGNRTRPRSRSREAGARRILGLGTFGIPVQSWTVRPIRFRCELHPKVTNRQCTPV